MDFNDFWQSGLVHIFFNSDSSTTAVFTIPLQAGFLLDIIAYNYYRTNNNILIDYHLDFRRFPTICFGNAIDISFIRRQFFIFVISVYFICFGMLTAATALDILIFNFHVFFIRIYFLFPFG